MKPITPIIEQLESLYTNYKVLEESSTENFNGDKEYALNNYLNLYILHLYIMFEFNSALKDFSTDNVEADKLHKEIISEWNNIKPLIIRGEIKDYNLATMKSIQDGISMLNDSCRTIIISLSNKMFELKNLIQ